MIETSVKVFASTDTGAPTLVNNAGALIALLDACLVTGYGLQTASSITVASGVGTANFGSNFLCNKGAVLLFAGATGSYTALNGERKVLSTSLANAVSFDATGLPDGTVTGTVTAKMAPAGWGKFFPGTNICAYKSNNVQSSGMYLRVDDTTTSYATVAGCESMTSMDVFTGKFPSGSTYGFFPKSNAATGRSWYVIANDKAVYLIIGPTTSYSTNYFAMMFGDIIPRKSGDPYRFALFAQNTDGSAAGSNASAYTYQPISYSVPSQSVRYLPRSYTALGAPVSLTTSFFGQGGNWSCGYNGSVFPNPVDNGILTTPMVIWEGNGIRGEFPGLYGTPQSINTSLVHGTVLENMAPANKTLMWISLAHNTSTYGGVFMDIIGPWGN